MKHLRPALVSLVLFTVLTGLAYPALITGLAQLIFPRHANGSLLRDSKESVIASELIGQSFSDPKYFWGRLSATSPIPYSTASTGSNYGPMNPALLDAAKTRIRALKNADPENRSLIPVDLVTASASGLDPHISIAAAQYQASRVARARGIELAKVQQLITANTQERTLKVFGEARVHVLRLNLALDSL